LKSRKSKKRDVVAFYIQTASQKKTHFKGPTMSLLGAIPWRS
jgi:hypothetical protein